MELRLNPNFKPININNIDPVIQVFVNGNEVTRLKLFKDINTLKLTLSEFTGYSFNNIHVGEAMGYNKRVQLEKSIKDLKFELSVLENRLGKGESKI